MIIRYKTTTGEIVDLGEVTISLGLLDKNGREIFEGDIIRHENGRLATVKYCKSSWAFDMRFSNVVLDQETSGVTSDVEVIN